MPDRAERRTHWRDNKCGHNTRGRRRCTLRSVRRQRSRWTSSGHSTRFFYFRYPNPMPTQGMACLERAQRVEWSRRDSNPRHLACKASALPTELRPRGERSEARDRGSEKSRIPNSLTSDLRPLTPLSVGAPRLELGTSALSGPRSNQLSYAPGPVQADHSKCAPARCERRPNMNPALSLSRVTGPQTLRDAKVRHFNPASRVAFANLPLIRIYSIRLT